MLHPSEELIAMGEEAISQRDAVEKLEHYGACDIITADVAQDIADAWDVDLDVENMRPLRDITPIFTGDGDAKAIGVAELIIEILEGLDVKPETPVYGGHGFTARARYEQNLPLLYDYMDLELDHEPGEEVYEEQEDEREEQE